MSRIRSYLGRYVPAAPASQTEIEALRGDVWHKQGIAVFDPREITDDWFRQAVINEATKRYGKRRLGR